MTDVLPVWRSLLFVPMTAQRFIDGAARRGGGAIVLDAADSVAASEKNGRGGSCRRRRPRFRAAARMTLRLCRRLGDHPSQVPILNEEFRPSHEEVGHARRMPAAYEQALAESIGAVTVDDRMIDVPFVERALAIAARKARVQELG